MTRISRHAHRVRMIQRTQRRQADAAQAELDRARHTFAWRNAVNVLAASLMLQKGRSR